MGIGLEPLQQVRPRSQVDGGARLHEPFLRVSLQDEVHPALGSHVQHLSGERPGAQPARGPDRPRARRDPQPTLRGTGQCGARGRARSHDASEVLTGDLPTPVKYFNPDIAVAYRAIEKMAREKLVSMVPSPLREAYRPYFESQESDEPLRVLVHAADKICGYLKSLEEISTGNAEFVQAEKALRAAIEEMALPEVHYFMDTFVASFRLTLDELK